MMKFTSISWYFFFLSLLVLFLVWLFTSRTKMGRSFVQQQTPWSMVQWSRVLLVVCITLFILVNPVFHLLTAAVLIGLYYLLVGNAMLPIVKQKSWTANESIPKFNSRGKHLKHVQLSCTGIDHPTLLAERLALSRCLFSFPYILEGEEPLVQYLDEKYEVILQLSDDQYLSSLLDYIKKSGFDIKHKITN